VLLIELDDVIIVHQLACCLNRLLKRREDVETVGFRLAISVCVFGFGFGFGFGIKF